MDLKDFSASTEDMVVDLSARYESLKNADGSHMTMTFYAPHSKEAKKIKHDLTDQKIAQIRETSGEIDKGITLSSAEIEELAFEEMVCMLKTWNITWDNKKPKATESKAREVLGKLPWVDLLYQEARAKSLNFIQT